MDNAQARLRRTFAYPTDDDTSSAPEAMDEEEQETLIQDLKTSNDSTNELYFRVFIFLPLACILPFLYHLIFRSSLSTLLPSLMSVTSLLISAFIMGLIPMGQHLTLLPFPLSSTSSASTTPATLSDIAHLQSRRRQQRSHPTPWERYLPGLSLESGSPIFRFVLPVNGGLSIILLLYAYIFSAKSGVPVGYCMLLLLPPVMFGSVCVVRQSMTATEKGLGELEGMKYGYKGA